MQDLPKNKKIILFDGVCNLCDNSVQLIIKHDTKDIFRFVALQSTLGQEITNYLGIDSQKMDSIILYHPGVAYYYKAEAALEIAKELGGVFSFARILGLFPISFSNIAYDYVAKNRYKWYGKKESCMMPTEALKSKFLS
jgi:predicted DCC family thiol-disulfide oxidoreductase YuxK